MAESPTMEVRARLTADSAQFTQGMERAVQSANEFQEASSKLQKSMTAIGIASGAAIAGLIAFGVKSFKAAAEVERLDLALESVGASSGKGYDALKQASDSMRAVGIQAAQAQRTTLKFAQSNIDLSKSADIARVAQDLSVASSMSGEQALTSLTFAITTANPRMLRQLGITTQASEAYAIYGRTIGKSASELNMAEKRQAVMNLVLQEGTKAAGAFALSLTSPAKLVEEFSQLNKELQVTMGGALVKGFGPIIKSTYAFQAAIVRAVGSGGKLEAIVEAIQLVLVKLTTPLSIVIDKFTEFIDGMDLTGTKVEDLAAKFEMILPVLVGFGTAFATMAGNQLLSRLPIFGKLAGFLNPVAVGFVALALTSTQVQAAFGRLLNALRPLLDVAKNVGVVFNKVLSVAIMVFAKAINGVASVVTLSISLIQRFAEVFKVLGVAIAAVALGYGAYRTVILLTTAATAIMGTVTAGVTIVINALRTAMAILNVTIAMNPIPLFIGVIVSLLVALGYLIKTNKKVGDAFKIVFNFIAKVVISVFAYIVKFIGYVLKAFASFMRVLGFFAEVFAKVFEFVIDLFLTSVQFILKGIKSVIDTFIKFMESQGILYNVVKTIFNGIIKVISLVVEGIVRVFAFVIGAVADLVGAFNKLFGGVKSIFLKVLSAVSNIGKGIFSVLNKVAEGIGNFLGDVFDAVTSFVRMLLKIFSKVPKIGPMVAKALGAGLDATRNAITGITKLGVGLGSKMFDGIINGITNTVNGISTIGNSVEKGLRATEKTLTKFAVKVEQFGNQDNGAKLIAGLVGGAKTASAALGTMIDALGEAVKFDFAGTVGKFIDSVADKADAAGDYLINLSTQMLAFADTTDFAGNVADGIGDFIGKIQDSLKEGLGFGDILKKERDKAAAAGGNNNDDALGDIQDQADLMKKIREAMKAGIESISDVLSDLQQAAKDFADSLKDTIMGFAGLKGIELPDGFIPKAKSLIENMRTRLNKSQQFASQITQLQALGLDASAIKDLVESGPIKGAQIAASILGGGAEAIAQINEIQKSIAFTGAAIGKFGSEAAFGQKIASAQAGIAQITDAEASFRGVGGNNIVIEQGAFVVNVDTTGATNQDEKADIITQRIQETFAILAKELANK
jgi:phage-related protein